MRCSFIKPGGERCKGTAPGGASLCYAHDPARAEERSRNARKAGRTGGNGRPGSGEVSELRREIRGVLAGVLTGRVERSTGSVMFQGFNTLLRALETDRKIREQDDLLERLEALEAQQEVGPSRGAGGHRAWHH